jgi:hypothetical protein
MIEEVQIEIKFLESEFAFQFIEKNMQQRVSRNPNLH